ncbi:hypothetical protein PR048_014204 [Dryococelus australis]|uniref:Uncharacterized protein n=1 Tax=Dryococelus australis TaxID=614101 RepID=A0ABQ9HDZ4_9NEOP|nr:hypothetical protein PR048_014204 [Dryococelus australis]
MSSTHALDPVVQAPATSFKTLSLAVAIFLFPQVTTPFARNSANHPFSHSNSTAASWPTFARLHGRTSEVKRFGRLLTSRLCSSAVMKGRGKRGIPEKTLRPTTSSCKIPHMRKSQGWPRRGFNPHGGGMEAEARMRTQPPLKPHTSGPIVSLCAAWGVTNLPRSPLPRFQTFRHRMKQLFCRFRGNFRPSILENPLKLFSARWAAFGLSAFKMIPQMLNRIQIWAPRWSKKSFGVETTHEFLKQCACVTCPWFLSFSPSTTPILHREANAGVAHSRTNLRLKRPWIRRSYFHDSVKLYEVVDYKPGHVGRVPGSCDTIESFGENLEGKKRKSGRPEEEPSQSSPECEINVLANGCSGRRNRNNPEKTQQPLQLAGCCDSCWVFSGYSHLLKHGPRIRESSTYPALFLNPDKHSILSSRNTLLEDTSDWKTLGSFLSATLRPSLGSVTALKQQHVPLSPAPALVTLPRRLHYRLFTVNTQPSSSLLLNGFLGLPLARDIAVDHFTRLTCSPPIKANRVQSIPSRLTPGFSQVGTVPDDDAGRRVFSRISRFSPALAFGRCSILTSFHPHRLSKPRKESPKSLNSTQLRKWDMGRVDLGRGEASVEQQRNVIARESHRPKADVYHVSPHAETRHRPHRQPSGFTLTCARQRCSFAATDLQTCAGAGLQVRGSTGAGLQVRGSAGAGLQVRGSAGAGLQVRGSAGEGLQVRGSTGAGLQVRGSTGEGLQVRGSTGAGLQVRGSTGAGLQVRGSTGAGLQVRGSTGAGLQVRGSTGAGLQVHDSTGAGLQVHGSTGAGLQVHGSASEGLQVRGSASEGLKVRGSASEGLKVRGSASEGLKVRGSASEGLKVRGSASEGLKVRGSASEGLQVRGSVGFRVRGNTVRCLPLVDSFSSPLHSIAAPNSPRLYPDPPDPISLTLGRRRGHIPVQGFRLARVRSCDREKVALVRRGRSSGCSILCICSEPPSAYKELQNSKAGRCHFGEQSSPRQGKQRGEPTAREGGFAFNRRMAESRRRDKRRSTEGPTSHAKGQRIVGGGGEKKFNSHRKRGRKKRQESRNKEQVHS